MAVLPTALREQVVLRIVHRATARLALPDLQMSPEAEAAFTRAIHQPYGAVIACGPTGSGKTTTLYAALDHLNDDERVLTTIEDPVEYQMPGVTQVEVNVKAGLTFARGLRTIIRSDPDVLLVGEIRDEETAAIAIQAAMTGHLVLTSLHAPSAASAIARLKAMGVEPTTLASSLNCIVAQRLARRLCPDCKQKYEPTPDERAELRLAEDVGVTLYRAPGCPRCARTGYRGRVALYEVMPVDGAVGRLIEASTEDMSARRSRTRCGRFATTASGSASTASGSASTERRRSTRSAASPVGRRRGGPWPGPGTSHRAPLGAVEGLQRAAVLAALRPEERRHAVVAECLLGAALLLEAARKREVRVVVDRLELENGAELLLGLGEAADPEVRDPERLPNRCLLGLPALRLLEGDRRLRVSPLGHVLTALSEEVIRLAHRRLQR
jgi:hypothetical protein